jgi:hypothetical protein
LFVLISLEIPRKKVLILPKIVLTRLACCAPIPVGGITFICLDNFVKCYFKATADLSQFERQPGYARLVMSLIEAASSPQDKATRQMASIMLKNYIKKNWAPSVSENHCCDD